jgi:hypothetical protein
MKCQVNFSPLVYNLVTMTPTVYIFNKQLTFNQTCIILSLSIKTVGVIHGPTFDAGGRGRLVADQPTDGL